MADDAHAVTPHGVVGQSGRFQADPFGLAQPARYRQGLAAQRAAAAGRAGGGGFAGGAFTFSVHIPLAQLAEALKEFGLTEQVWRGVILGLNHTAAKVRTELKRELQKWTGIKLQATILAAMHLRGASRAHLEANVNVQDKHRRIDRENFGAKWAGRYSPVLHNAWGKQQATFGAFMLPGRAPAFHRVGRGRSAIKPLYGPNLAREMQRNEATVRGIVRHAGEVELIPRIIHEITQAGVRAAGKVR